MNLATWVERNAWRWPDRPALAVGDDVCADWATFADQTAAIAGGLHGRLGLQPGDRVAIVMRNRAEYLEALFAIWHAGLVAVPVNARLHRDEIAFILDQSGSSAVIVDPDHADDVSSLLGSVGMLRACVITPDEHTPGDGWSELLGPRRFRSSIGGPRTRRGCSTRAERPGSRKARRCRIATC